MIVIKLIMMKIDMITTVIMMTGPNISHCSIQHRFMMITQPLNTRVVIHLFHLFNGPLTRYVKLRVAHAPGMRVNDPDIHHGTCVTHVP